MRQRSPAPVPWGVALRRATRAAVERLLGRRATTALAARATAARLASAEPAFGPVRRWGIPVFVDEAFHPRWVLDRGRVPHRVFLATIPKAGTHMMAKMLTRLDLVNCDIHVQVESVVDQRFAPDAMSRHYPTLLSRPIDLADTLALVAPGQFAFGHIGLRSPEVRALLHGFKVVLMVRDLRDVYVSLLRYFRERKDMPLVGSAATLLPSWADLLVWDMERQGPNRLMGFQHLAQWRDEPNVLCLRYEEVVGDFGRHVQVAALERLTRFLDVEASRPRLEDVLDTVIGQPTVTKMDRRTVAAEYWDDEVEKRYRRIGFPALNRDLGYPEPSLD